MLSSTRATARSLVARASTSYAQALPAESSRQGLLRAIAQQQQQQLADQRRSIHRRRNGSTYSTAVAYAEDERQDVRAEEEGTGYWAERRSGTIDPRYSLPRHPDLDPALDTADLSPALALEQNITAPNLTTADGERPASLSTSTLVDLIASNPTQAFVSLPLCTPEILSNLTSRHLTDLLKNIYKASRDHGGPFAKLSPTQAERSLAILRNLLHDLPSSPHATDSGLGKRFRRDLLSRFLRACVILDCDALLRDTMQERLAAEVELGEQIVQPDILATALAGRRRWDLIIDLLSPARFPVASHTPISIWRLMQAHLGSGRAYKVPSLHLLHADLGLTPLPRANALLVQSHLMLGDIASARQVMRDTISEGKSDDVAQQLAILKGYRELGKDDELERKALDLAKGMEPAHEAAIVHALVRLRLDGNDITGARSLLARFRLPTWATSVIANPDAEAFVPALTPAAYLEASGQTLQLAFRAAASSMDLRRLETAWQDLVSASAPNSSTAINVDDSLGLLIATLARMGQLDLAWITLTRSSSSPFALPAHYRPGVSPLNILLSHASRAEGYPGLERALELFRSVEVKPNERTLQFILESVRTTTSGDPATLANLTNALLRQMPGVKPATDHVDLLLSQAVRARSRSARLARDGVENQQTDDLTVPAESESTNAHAGLRTNDPFKEAMKGIIQSLKDRGARSASRSLATRLRFDAQTSSNNDGPVPSARMVWTDMLSRGYTPDKRHLLALMKGYADSGHMSECEDAILLAKDTGVEVTRGMWMVLMTGYGRRLRCVSRDGDAAPEGQHHVVNIDRAEKAYKAIRNSKQGLDPAAVCAMIGIYQRAKRRPMAAQLALQLVGNLVPDLSPNAASSSFDMPAFPSEMFDERVIAIATDALRLDHPYCALQVIAAQFPTTLPSRVKQVVRSIRSRSRARIHHRIDSAVDHDVLALAQQMLKGNEVGQAEAEPATATKAIKIGPNGVKKRILRLFERKKHTGRRGAGGRKAISAKEERRVRHETIHDAKHTSQTPAQS